MIERGQICWIDPGEPRGSMPAKRRPVLVVQADAFNASRLDTTLVVIITSNHQQRRDAGQRLAACQRLGPSP